MRSGIEKKLIGLQNNTRGKIEVIIQRTEEVGAGRVTQHSVKSQQGLLINTDYLDRITIQ